MRAEGCSPWFVTGYVRGVGNDFTADGTWIFADENLAAATSLPFDTYVWVEGYGRFRVADRGLLGPRHLDLAVWTLEEAYAATGWRCVTVEG